jgi:hypothetical protein
MSERESMAAFARRCGVSKMCVSKWKRRGLLVFAANGLVDVAASNAVLAQRPQRYRGGAVKRAAAAAAPNGAVERSGRDGVPADPPDPSTWSTAEAIRQKEIASARLRQIEADTAAGLVVPIAEVADAVRGEYGIVRTALLGMAAKLAHRLAAATTPEECGALVDTEVRTTLASLTRDAAA